jgi:hypothetical protein
MRANESPRRCKCDECRDAYSILCELDLFEPSDDFKGAKKDALVVTQ